MAERQARHSLASMEVEAAITDGAVRESLDDLLVSSLRPVCVGLAFFFALLALWYGVHLGGEAREVMGAASGLISMAMLAAAVWFERNTLPARLANPVASLMALVVIGHSLLLLVSVPEPRMTTNLMIAMLGFGCLLLSVRWFLATAALSVAGWLWVVGARRVDPDWYHFGLALAESVAFGLIVLVVRIRAYGGQQRLRLRDRQLLRRLEEANEAALVAVRAKSQFLANMSHEIRTPMTAMLGMTELLQMSEMDEAQTEYADAIARAGETLLTLVNDILDFSKIEAGQLSLEVVKLNLQRIVDDVQGMLAVKAKRTGLMLMVEYDEKLPTRFRGDPTRLQQVLVNLVGNAIKFTKEGSVTIRVSGQQQQAAVWLVSVEVIDTGIGIPPGHMAHIFEAFTQADASTTRNFGGTGLGLAISRQLARLMGGELSVDSVQGEGSTFRLSVPLSAEGSLSTIPAPEANVRTDFEGKVLLVEDNPENQRLARQMLATFGCQVSVAASGQQALDVLEEGGFDLVFMDCQMAGMNGYDATAALRAREGEREHLPVVALTANVLPEERERCRAVGMDDFVAKPFNFKDLHDVLERWL